MAIAALEFRINPPLSNAMLNALFSVGLASWQRGPDTNDWQPVLRHSLVYVCAFEQERLVGFVNVAWDGRDHAFILDTRVHPDHRHRGIGRELVRRAALAARERGCEVLHVDYSPELHPFYAACGFAPTRAGLIVLSTVATDIGDSPVAAPLAGSVRHADARDIEPSVAINPLTRRDLIAEHFHSGAGRVAVRGDEVIAFAIVTNHFFGRPFLDLVVVREQCRRTGIGRQLVAAVVREHSGARVFTSTNESNVPMLRLLEGLGFVSAGVIHGLDPGDPELVFFIDAI